MRASAIWLLNVMVLLAGCGAARLFIGSGDGGALDASPAVEVGRVAVDASEAADAGAARTLECLAPAGSVVTAMYPGAVVSADVNGDGSIDLVVGEAGPGAVEVFLGRGDGTFEATSTRLTATVPVAVGDVNGDGNLDIVATALDASRLNVFLGNGDGSFRSAAVDRELGDTPSSLTIVDLDGNGRPDIAVATSIDITSPVGHVLVMLGKGDGTFDAPVSYATAFSSTDSVPIAASDLDGDRHQDLLLSSRFNSNLIVFLGVGDGTMGPPTFFGTGDFSQPTSLAVGDIDRDGRPDAVVSNLDLSTAGVLLGRGDGVFPQVVQYPTSANAQAITIADIDGDERPDLIYLINMDPPGIGVLFAGVEGGFQLPATMTYPRAYPTAPSPQPVALAIVDMTGDHKPDLAVAEVATRRIQIFRNTCGR